MPSSPARALAGLDFSIVLGVYRPCIHITPPQGSTSASDHLSPGPPNFPFASSKHQTPVGCQAHTTIRRGGCCTRTWRKARAGPGAHSGKGEWGLSSCGQCTLWGPNNEEPSAVVYSRRVYVHTSLQIDVLLPVLLSPETPSPMPRFPAQFQVVAVWNEGTEPRRLTRRGSSSECHWLCIY